MAESEELLRSLLRLIEEKQNKGTTRVWFEALYEGKIVRRTRVPDQLTFSKIKHNEGGGLSETGDVFVVPVRGTYAFNLTFTQNVDTTGHDYKAGDVKRLQLKVNGVEIVLSLNPSGDLSASAVLKLDEGNRVTAWVDDRLLFEDYMNVRITFSGTLMHKSF